MGLDWFNYVRTSSLVTYDTGVTINQDWKEIYRMLEEPTLEVYIKTCPSDK